MEEKVNEEFEQLMATIDDVLAMARTQVFTRLTDLMNEFGKEFSESEKKKLTNRLYWEVDDIKANTILEAFGYRSNHEVGKVAGSYVTDFECNECGNNIEITNIIQLKRLKSRGGNAFDWYHHKGTIAIPLCKTCAGKIEAKQRKESNKAWVEQQKKWEEENRIWEENWRKEEQEKLSRQVELKTMPYAEYLQSDHWQKRKNKHLKSIKRKCQVCDKRQDMLHISHKNSERLGEELFSDLLALCLKRHDALRKAGKTSNGW